MNLFKKIITILFISILLVACAKPESPSDVVEGYLKDIKKDFNNLFENKTVEIDMKSAKLSLLERPFFIALRLFTPLL